MGEATKQYYLRKIQELELQLLHKNLELESIMVQCYDLGTQVKMLKGEMRSVSEERSSYVGEVIKVLKDAGKCKVMVKINPTIEKLVVEIGEGIDITKLTPSTRVALRPGTYVIHEILPNKVDPSVKLMKVKKVPDTTYDMIGGLDKQIKELREVFEFPIKHPELFEGIGITQPKGVILYGPPGNGKTLVARAVAHHANCSFIKCSGSELAQKHIGEGARLVREIFLLARKFAQSIIFIDEIDSIGSARALSNNSEVQRTMSELLSQLDGFEESNEIKVLMATNRIDILDPALLRSGRIDRKIEFPNPSEKSRVDILKIHTRKMNLMRGIDLKRIAEKTHGASGAMLKAVCTEAGMFALRERRPHVTQEDFDMAVEKVKKMEEKKNTEKEENISLQQIWK
ncbi:hypothetical protein P3X46_007782 [Hevea brasiliensis]|uniref:AAA+ ATPase domain-containing protein n=2 Tax=Hevea brasiliensis TaxID=3981 RepID=A0ABQ9MUP0_HEVBR|nr:hypothetical protein P3X46_007782 [Hevea brasiliensis]